MHSLRIAWWIRAWWTTCPYSGLDFSEKIVHVRVSNVQVVITTNEWFPPPTGIVKFNVDGLARGASGISGIGGILRNAGSVKLGFFSKLVGVLWAFQEKVQAILHALLFCKEFYVRDMIIERDSSLAEFN